MKKIHLLSTLAFFLFFLNHSSISANTALDLNDDASVSSALMVDINTADNTYSAYKKPKRRKKNKGRSYQSQKPKWQCFALWTNIHAASGPRSAKRNRENDRLNKKINKKTKRYRNMSNKQKRY